MAYAKMETKVNHVFIKNFNNLGLSLITINEFLDCTYLLRNSNTIHHFHHNNPAFHHTDNIDPRTVHNYCI